MADKPPEPEPTPAPTPSDEPDWARRLRESIESLPGKLRASISDDDKRGIAESVHGLFERSGAFERPPANEPPENEPPEPHEQPAKPPEPEPGDDSLARRLFGRH